MPIFEYHCLDCHAQFDRLCSADQRDASGPCPQCGSARTKRALSVFAVARSGAGREEAPAPASGGGCACGGNCGCR